VEHRKAVEVAKMGFLDHGSPIIPIESTDFINDTKAVYTNPITDDRVLLVGEGGQFKPLTNDMKIVEKKFSRYFPIEESSAIVCENDAFLKLSYDNRYVFRNMCDWLGIEKFHIMYNFRSRSEDEIIEAFKNTPAIIFRSSHTSVDWFELMLRCIIKSGTKAKVIGNRNGYNSERFDKCKTFAERFGVMMTSELR